MEEQLAVLAPNRQKTLRRILMMIVLGYSAFANRADIKRGWQDGWAGKYNPPVASPQK
jgi:hypothetical protein